MNDRHRTKQNTHVPGVNQSPRYRVGPSSFSPNMDRRGFGVALLSLLTFGAIRPRSAASESLSAKAYLDGARAVGTIGGMPVIQTCYRQVLPIADSFLGTSTRFGDLRAEVLRAAAALEARRPVQPPHDASPHSDRRAP